MLNRARAQNALLRKQLHVALRFGGGSAGHIDHSDAFYRGLSANEEDALASQKARTVSKIVPGKVFMRHWIAAEQATVSIYNRGMSVMVSYGLIMAAGLYSAMGFTGLNAWVLASFVLFAIFLELHVHMPLLPCFLGLYVIALFMGWI